jgi:ATP-binding cassette subfamily F protein 3
VCDEFWLVSRGGVEPFEGDLDDYQRYLLDEGKRLRESLKEAGRVSDKAAEPGPATPPVTAKRTPGKLKPLKQTLEKLEKSLAALQADKAALEARLAGTPTVEEIKEMGRQLQQVNAKLAREEEEWLELSGQIEALEAESA